jgi:hypothetical protein
MADTTVSNTVAERRAGSSPALGTKTSTRAGKLSTLRCGKGNARTAAGPYGHLFRELSAGQLYRPDDKVTGRPGFGK